TPTALAQAVAAGTVQILDLRPAMSYRKAHIPQAVWAIRPRIGRVIRGPSNAIVLVADDPAVAALAAVDLAELGHREVGLLAGGLEAWSAAGLVVEATPDAPADADCIDFLFFTSKRHEGDAEAARQYLAWEVGLVDQLDAQERGAFRIGAAA